MLHLPESASNPRDASSPCTNRPADKARDRREGIGSVY